VSSRIAATIAGLRQNASLETRNPGRKCIADKQDRPPNNNHGKFYKSAPWDRLTSKKNQKLRYHVVTPS